MSKLKHRALVDTLYEKTTRGEVEWSEVTMSSTTLRKTYQVDFSRSSIRILHDESVNSNKYMIQMFNSEGKSVDRFSDEDIEISDGSLIYFNRMMELFNMAKRKSLGSDVILDEILNELKKNDN